jgi:hypothetical protein
VYANDESKYIIVEVTPRTRQRYHFPSTTTLKKLYALHARARRKVQPKNAPKVNQKDMHVPLGLQGAPLRPR